MADDRTRTETATSFMGANTSISHVVVSSIVGQMESFAVAKGGTVVRLLGGDWFIKEHHMAASGTYLKHRVHWSNPGFNVSRHLFENRAQSAFHPGPHPRCQLAQRISCC